MSDFDLDLLGADSRSFTVDLLEQLATGERISFNAAVDAAVKFGLSDHWADNLIRRLETFGAVYRGGRKNARTLRMTELGRLWWTQR